MRWRRAGTDVSVVEADPEPEEEADEEETDEGGHEPPELPLDVMRLIWGQLSSSQRLQASWVCNEWRSECAGSTWEKAVSLVTAGVTVSDSDLSRSQQALRGIQRVLRGENPFSVAPVPALQPWRKGSGTWKKRLGPAEQTWKGANGVDEFGLRHFGMGDSVMTWYRLSEGVGRRVVRKVSVTMHWRHSNLAKSPYADWASICLRPESPEESDWMEGLLFALTGGFQGLLRAGNLSDMPGSVALKELRICWDGPRPLSTWVWPLRRARDAPGSSSFHVEVTGPTLFKQIFRAT